MDVQKLIALATIVEAGSMTRAAEQLGYSQAGLTYMMNSLENELGLCLLDRGYSGVRLSESGRQLMPEIRRFLRSYDSLDAAIRSCKQAQNSTLRIAAVDTVSQRWLPETIARLRAEYPHVRVSVVSESPLVINNWMKDGSVDLAVTNRAWTSKELGWVSVFKDLFRGVFPTGSIKGDSVPLERFSGEAVIMPDYGQNVDVPRIFKKHHIDVAYADDRMGNRSVLAAVAAGLGVTIMPQLELDYYAVQNVVTLPLEPRQYREMGVATPRGGQPAPIAQEFVRYLKQVVKKIEKPPVNPEEA